MRMRFEDACEILRKAGVKRYEIEQYARDNNVSYSNAIKRMAEERAKYRG